MAVLFAWNERPKEKISLENLRLATELPDAELRRTLWVFLLCERVMWWSVVLIILFIVAGSFSQVEETVVDVPTRSPVTERLHGELYIFCEPGLQLNVGLYSFSNTHIYMS